MFSVLDKLHARRPVDVLIQGGAPGADKLAKDWAERQFLYCMTIHAEWKELRGLAGPVRNTRMLDVGRPDVVVAFPGGSGTNDLTTKSVLRGIETWAVSTGGKRKRLNLSEGGVL